MSVDSFNLFVSKWVTPATVVIVFGAIVWGVQLNFLMLEHSRAIGLHAEKISTLGIEQKNLEFNAQKTAIILDQAVRSLSDIIIKIETHDAEAETWKRQILLNQQNIEQ